MAADFPELNLISILQRKPRRLTITIPYQTYQDLIERSDQEGRSLSDLAAFLMQQALLDSPTRQS